MQKDPSTVCPIHTLPPGVLGQIFAAVCSNDYSFKVCCPSTLSNDSLLSSPTLLLTQVCSSWRSLISSLPNLWSSISIESRHLYGRPALAALVVTYISRSGSAPLKFRLESDSAAPEIELQVFDHLLRNASRWSDVVMHVSPPWIQRAASKLESRLLSNSPACFPNLEYFTLRIHSERSIDRKMLQTLPAQLIHSSPKLKSFSGFGFNLSWNGIGPLPGSHSLVTGLVLDKFTGRSLAHLLRGFPFLKMCSIGGFELSDSDNHAAIFLEDHLYLSEITHLSHTSPWDTFQRGAWQNLRLPNLVSLELHYGDHSISELSSLLCQSHSPLRELELHNFPVAEIIRLLHSVPTVVHLRVYSDAELSFFNQLTTGLTLSSYYCPVPNLLSLELRWNDHRYKRLSDPNFKTLQISIRDGICGTVDSRSVSKAVSALNLQKLAVQIRDGDFLELELLYEMPEHRLSSMDLTAFQLLDTYHD
ncbi:hypothetical protein GYMLUDRAFT_259941 [Collybiopsis luxurians FD-317 M1]|uniref:F-box domain-containing protein n=1 Tax=Collybiopsis luxurians FD-317 M1 TaxID=944289 RepID=A0A0D0CK29_9AGAR|nr:hypothetical protein GYMLUDRAFT_259941 [Collybiopsis luxurians FD-317 M1]